MKVNKTDHGSADKTSLAEASRNGPGFDITGAARLLHALSNPVRFQIVTMLMQQDLDVGSISVAVGLGQSPTSQHLKILRDSRVVKTRRDAQRVLYSLSDPGAARIVETVEAVLSCSQPRTALGKRSK